MRFQKITHFDTANGIGIRTVLWVQGCSHYCKECHNPQTWDLDGGKLFTDYEIEDILSSLDSPHIAGVTFSGGDPLHPNNRDDIGSLAKLIKEKYPDKTIWCYTGYKWDEIKHLKLIKYIDVLVDGEFHIKEKDISLAFCGSKNQKVLDVKKSLKKRKIILWRKDNI